MESFSGLVGAPALIGHSKALIRKGLCRTAGIVQARLYPPAMGHRGYR